MIYFLNNSVLDGNTVPSKGGVVAYPVMQAYGSLAMEDNLEVGEEVRQM